MASVLSLDRNPAPLAYLQKSLLELTTLLEGREAMLADAKEHINLEVLADFMLKIIRHNSEAWPQQVVSAAWIVVSILEPRSPGGGLLSYQQGSGAPRSRVTTTTHHRGHRGDMAPAEMQAFEDVEDRQEIIRL
eukprot:TRINITY_DN114854_c0_g1_i1.p1 TRINITY_DN114854_c0_g1~~TRINITY_DN114854_c0_g1_i1.p1  ORF type:complete len:149 (+),score=23.82 TRINITY_DN114854_c0_g1_i1:47-448(+)